MRIPEACVELLEDLWLDASLRSDEEVPFGEFAADLLTHGRFHVGELTGPQYTDELDHTYLPLEDGGIYRADGIRGCLCFGVLLYPGEPPEEILTPIGVPEWN